MNQVVSEHWDGSLSPPPIAAKPVSWLGLAPALLALMVVPRRVGPRLAQSGWIKPIVVSLVSALLAAGMVAVSIAGVESILIGGRDSLDFHPGSDGDRLPTMTPDEWARFPAAFVVSGAYRATENRGEVWGLAAAVLGAHALCWVAAVLIMPFVSAGERGKLLYRRSVRLTLWACVCLVPLGVGSATITVLFMIFDMNEWTHEAGLFVPLIVFWLAWVISIVLRLGSRYAGPADGPAWRPREPDCAECGYNLTGQPLEGHCPECGADVILSTPDFRTPPAWARASGCVQGATAYFRTSYQILRHRDFFRRLSVHGGRATAVRFMTWTLAFFASVVTLGLVAFAREEIFSPSDTRHLVESIVGLLTVAIVVGLLGFVCLSLVILRSAHVGKCGILPTAVTVCYASVLLLPACLFLSICLWSRSFTLDAGWLTRAPLPEDWPATVRYYVFHLLNPGPTIAALTWAMFRLRRALKDVRFAAA